MRVPVLMYHGVSDMPGGKSMRYTIAPHRFAGHMRALSRAGYAPISITDFMGWLGGERDLPANPVLLTFDDGYLGVYEHAAPVLEEHGWPYTVFLVSSLIGKSDRWVEGSNGKDHWHRLLDRRQIIELQAKGVNFQSHSATHPRLTQFDDRQLQTELESARDDLEQMLDKPVEYLAYPFGDVDDRVVERTRQAGYKGAFSTRSGFNTEDTEPFLLRRIEVMGEDTPSMLMRKIRLGCNNGSIGHMATYYLGRIWARLS